ncbi:hypothetical protein B0A48_09919 [Cryoendolithus antarcticus]|uniref:Spt20-like SEP domain-containing protein n=1 Tax=Cryoendolithus antarcticus TaxID=1507870 RepID=A0A1V8T3E7_9PEZI|nr:hypothetical protein B0A48_09919 [Cryoendolithus antarcticus]
MASAAIARPSQSIRRTAPRPSGSKRSAPDSSTALAPPPKRTKFTEPYVLTSAHILAKHANKPPSLVLHLHQRNFRFDGQDGSWGYAEPMNIVLKHLRKGTVPHEILEELHAQGVGFYDGCLIVKVLNHRSKEAGEGGGKVDDKGQFTMHEHHKSITPSPYGVHHGDMYSQDAEDAKEKKAEEAGKGKGKDAGPKVTTVVLLPTEQSRHEDLMIMAKMPAAELSKKRKDTVTPMTPSGSVPPTPIGGPVGGMGELDGRVGMSQKDLYEFQADQLVAAMPPLCLDLAGTIEESHAIIDMLKHPLHSEKAPTTTERKKTTAEVAAEDAQAAEEERRFLIMDERNKPAARAANGTTTGDNSSSIASLVNSRFETINKAKIRHEEAKTLAKEEEQRAGAEKRAQDEQNQLAQRQMAQRRQQEQVAQQQLAQSKQRQLMAAQAQAEAMRHQQLAQQQQQMQLNVQQQQANMMQAHGHPGMQQNGVQASPVMRQQTQTPMMTSSPMVPQSGGGVPMTQSSSQQGMNAGSPPRPLSAAMQHPQHPNVSMVRQASQQAGGSRNNTPQMQSTPSMAQVMPGNRQVSATPRMQSMQPNSPAVSIPQGTPAMMQQTPNPAAAAMIMQQQAAYLAQVNQQGMTAEQAALMTMQRANPQNMNGNTMPPEAFQMAQRMSNINEQMKQTQAQHQQGLAQGDQGMQAAALKRMQLLRNNKDQVQRSMLQFQAQQQAGGNQQQMTAQGMQQANMLQMQAQQQALQAQQQQQNMPHSHPQTQQELQQRALLQQQQAAAAQQAHLQAQAAQQQHPQSQAAQQQQHLLAAQQRAAHDTATRQIRTLLQQHNGAIPPNVIATMPPLMQNMLRKQQQQQHLARQAALQRQQQAGGNGAPNGVGGGGGGGGMEQYQANLQKQQRVLQMQMQAQQVAAQQQAGGNGGGQQFGLGGLNMAQQQQQQYAAAQVLQAQQQRQAMQQGQQNGGGGGGGDGLESHFAAMAATLQQGRQGGGT